MNAKDFISILEYTESKKAFKRPSKKKEIDLDKLNLAEVFLKLTNKEEEIKAAKKQIEQLLKKEEKKEEKKKFNTAHLAMWMIVTAPITGPLMLYYWSYIFYAIRSMQ